MAIPKKIHYCWFGGNPLPEDAVKCIKSWKKHCPDYEIIEWNESNFDVNCNLYCKQAYECKKWAFVADYARLWILYHHGGVYFDTDVKMIKNIDRFLTDPSFMCVEKSISVNKVATGLGLGAEKGNEVIKAMMDDYNEVAFIVNGEYDITTCTVRNTEILKKFGFVEENRYQNLGKAIVYPSEYFSPIEMESNKKTITKNTYTIHLYSLSWTPLEHQIERKKAFRRLKVRNYFYNIKVLPNNVLLKILGQEKYTNMKRIIKR